MVVTPAAVWASNFKLQVVEQPYKVTQAAPMDVASMRMLNSQAWQRFFAASVAGCQLTTTAPPFITQAIMPPPAVFLPQFTSYLMPATVAEIVSKFNAYLMQITWAIPPPIPPITIVTVVTDPASITAACANLQSQLAALFGQIHVLGTEESVYQRLGAAFESSFPILKTIFTGVTAPSGAPYMAIGTVF